MPAQRNAEKLGATLIVVTLLLLAILIWLPQTITAGPMTEFRVRFPQEWALPTLTSGGKVLVGGKPVGTVSKAELSPPDENKQVYLLVTARMDSKVSLRKDCKIRAVGEVLGGGGSLSIDVGTSETPADLSQVLDGSQPGGFGAYLESLGRELDANNPRSLLGKVKQQLSDDVAGSLMAKLHRSMDDLNTISRSMAVQLDAEQKRSLLWKFAQVVENANATMTSIRAEFEKGRPDAALAKVQAALDSLNLGLATARGILDDNRQPLNETFHHVASTAAKVDTRIAESIAEQVDARHEGSLMAKLHESLDSFGRSLADLEVVSDTARNVAIMSREDITSLIRNMRQTSDYLKSTAKYLRARPWRLLNAPTAREDRQQSISLAAGDFAEAAAGLDDVTARLEALSDLHKGVIPAGDPDLARIRAELTATFEKFRKAEESLWKELDVR